MWAEKTCSCQQFACSHRAKSFVLGICEMWFALRGTDTKFSNGWSAINKLWGKVLKTLLASQKNYCFLALKSCFGPDYLGSLCCVPRQSVLC